MLAESDQTAGHAGKIDRKVFPKTTERPSSGYSKKGLLTAGAA
jgi:hypothetical protein